MASSNGTYSVSDQKLILSKQIHSGSYSSSLMLLKDYLLDDLSSCSSNGFKSFPRRPCCTTVSLLIDKDLLLKPRQSSTAKRVLKLKRSRSTNVASTTLSALQKLSEAVIRAVKQLPLPSAKSSASSALSVQSKTKKSLLPRSFSRKLLKKSFWKKAITTEEEKEGDGIRQWRLFRDFLEDQDKPSDHNTQPKSCKVVVVGSRVPTSSSDRSTDSHSDSNSETCGESEFTSGILQSSSAHSESSSENDVVDSGDDDVALKKVSHATVGEVSSEELTTTKEWPNEEKEQFSPVSVLDSPFDDEEDVASPFHSKLSRMEGTKNKLMQKIRRFEKKLDFLEPVDLEKRMALSEFEQGQDESSFELCFLPRKSTCDDENSCKNLIKEITARNQSEERARDLHKIFIHRTSLSNCSRVMKTDNLLFDFFEQSVRENVNEGECWTEAEDWLAGNPKELYLGWEVREGRRTYLKDIEKSGQWEKSRDEEKREIALDLEMEVLSCLIDELILEL